MTSLCDAETTMSSSLVEGTWLSTGTDAVSALLSVGGPSLGSGGGELKATKRTILIHVQAMVYTQEKPHRK